MVDIYVMQAVPTILPVKKGFGIISLACFIKMGRKGKLPIDYLSNHL